MADEVKKLTEQVATLEAPLKRRRMIWKLTAENAALRKAPRAQNRAKHRMMARRRIRRGHRIHAANLRWADSFLARLIDGTPAGASRVGVFF